MNGKYYWLVYVTKKKDNESNINDDVFDPDVMPTPNAECSASAISNSNIMKILKTRKSFKQYFGRAKCYGSESNRKKYLDKLYVRMIATDMDPLRKGEHEGFRNFVAGLDEKYEIPSTTTLKESLLPNYYQSIKIELQSALNSTQDISLTSDMWTNANNEGILAITTHFIYKKQLIAPLLAAIRIEGRHTSEAMAAVSFFYFNFIF